MRRAITLPMVAGLVDLAALRAWDAVSEARIESTALISVPLLAVANPRFQFHRWLQ